MWFKKHPIHDVYIPIRQSLPDTNLIWDSKKDLYCIEDKESGIRGEGKDMDDALVDYWYHSLIHTEFKEAEIVQVYVTRDNVPLLYSSRSTTWRTCYLVVLVEDDGEAGTTTWLQGVLDGVMKSLLDNVIIDYRTAFEYSGSSKLFKVDRDGGVTMQDILNKDIPPEWLPKRGERYSPQSVP